MVGPINGTGRQGDIPIRVPDNDSGHVAHSIKSATIDINGNRTDFLVEPFHDRIFVLVTQNQKMGTILIAGREETASGAESFTVKVLVGKRDIPELELCARAVIATMANEGCAKPLLISLSLKDHSMRTMRQVIEKIKELRVW